MSRGRGGGGGRGGYRGGRTGPPLPTGPPDTVLEMGTFMHACEGEIMCLSINTKIPYFNAPIYLENKTAIGKVDEILGPINEVFFTIKPQEGIVATSFKPGDKFYIGPDKLLPLERCRPWPWRLQRRSRWPIERKCQRWSWWFFTGRWIWRSWWFWWRSWRFYWRSWWRSGWFP
ncbi:hypothetical protein LIPSTDRAFT_57250 [Lipomyces starkeyi NRRL Y-11557]|uniref:H/ACA ribonucleoprotein complex subunit n=1 Tax=Lipomyces starkeyi NRRL Y-11557 TaxID=675824 RepID=A0A1E3PYP1_LIPST|nr:hypothetical protein LIPSTDRAFT_57250 [Lipomyces starkeyi NRRL Y-11557]